MLLLGAFRDVDPIPGQPLTAFLAEVAREPVTRRLSLAGLREQDIAEYVELTASQIASPELATALYEGTEGNPLFVTETVRLLSLEGLGPGSSGGVRLDIPQSVRDVITRRLAHLPVECNRVLVLASVLGREFAPDVLARLSGVSEEELFDTLEDAAAARVVSDVPGGPALMRFAHVLIRDTLYEGLTAARRVRLHRLAVEALEAFYGEEPGPHLAELAYHSIAGSSFEQGLRYALRAGDRARALLAYEEAARLYQLALDALDLVSPQDDERRCELLLALGEAESAAGDIPTAKEIFLDAADIGRRLGLPRELAHAAVGYGGRNPWARAGDDDRLVPLLEEGLAAIADQDVELRARLLARLAGALRDEHSRDRRDALSGEAVELARLSENPVALAHALDARMAAIFAPDTVAGCLALSSELCEVAGRIGDTERLVAGHWNRFMAHTMVGDVEEAKVDLAAVVPLADELRLPAEFFNLRAAQASLALEAGRLGDAEELAREAFELGARALPEMVMPVYVLQQYTLRGFQGRLDEVEPALCALIATYPARPVFRCALVCLYAELGRTAEAKRALDELAADNFSALPFDQEWLFGMSLLAETCALVSHIDAAEALYGRLLPWAAFNAVDFPEAFRGSLSRYLGLLAATTGIWDDAILHFESALEMNERMGAWPWLAHTQNDFACMLLARDAPGDKEEAHRLLSRALGTYLDLGMQSYAAKVSAHERGEDRAFSGEA